MIDPMTRVAYQRRAETQRRLAAIRRFERNPSRAHAKVIAAETGMSISLIYALVTAWRETGRAESLSGAGAARSRQSPVTQEQRRAVLDALALDPDAGIVEIAARAEDIAKSRQLQLPSALATIRKIVAAERTGWLAKGSPFLNADFACLRCAIDIPVSAPGGEPVMPIATIVLDVAGHRPGVLGLALSIDPPGSEAIALALVDAILGHPESDPIPTRVVIMARETEHPLGVIAALGVNGITVATAAPKPFNGNDVVSLLGMRPAGLTLKPGLITRERTGRIAHILAGASALALPDATVFVRERLVDAFPPTRGIPLEASARRLLPKRLAVIVDN